VSAGPPAPRDPAEPAATPAAEAGAGQGAAAVPAAEAPPRVRVRLPLHRVWLTYVFLALIGVVFLGQLASEQLLGFDYLAALGAKHNAAIAAGQYWRLVTPIFLHGGLLHVFFNMYALYNLGREVEAFMGPARFLLVFFYAGVAGTVFSLLFTPNPSLGASGAIFGLIGAQGIFLYRHRQLFGERGRRGLQQIIMIALINLAIGLQGNIDNWAHVGGLLGGVGLSWALGPAWRLEPAPLNPSQAVIVNQPDETSTRGLVIAGLLVGLAALTAVGVVLAG
jgi:rhomboid protease GluP